MITYEHKLAIARPDQVIETCDKWGKEGWELGGCYHSRECNEPMRQEWPTFIMLIFKRRVEK